MKDELIASLLGTAMGTANNVVNKVAEDHRRTLEKEEAIAREQEQTKRAIAQEEERTRREFVEKGLDKRHREEIKELQAKRDATPIDTVCESCTGTMDIDRHKGMMTCPYCGHTEVLPPVHCYDPLLDDNDIMDLKPRTQVVSEPAVPKHTPASDLKQNTTQSGVTVEKLNVRPNKSFSSEAMASNISGVTRLATAADKAAVDEEPLLNKVVNTAKLIDTKPVEGFVKHETRGLVLSIISIICGVVGLLTCGVLVVPEILGVILSLIPIIGSKAKYGKLSKTLAAIGLVASLSAGVLVLMSVIILKR